ncbi:hypothetical protein [Chamaesiphon sp. OTE_8_metabat_110]|nr:hypothetical protein [Chamaesiphon sp. OTE_8_metabat_110]
MSICVEAHRPIAASKTANNPMLMVFLPVIALSASNGHSSGNYK